MSLDYAQLAALAAVVGEGSFDGAARALHVTPSAVSQRIRQLEERVGAVLVQRGTPCVATAAGTPLLRHAERVALLEAELAATLPAQASARGNAATATLRIAVNADSLATWFVPALAAFASAHPQLRIDLLVDDQEHTAEALRRGDVLAAVSASAEPVQGCRSQPLGRLRYCATASPAFVRRWFAQGVNAASLERAPCLLFNRKDQLQTRWMRRITRRAIAPACHGLPSSQGFVEACLAGLGWGMNPQALVQSHLTARRLLELVPGQGIDVPLHWQASRLALPALADLTNAVRAVAKDALQ
jgi:LysR family transcriptional regulator, chromosome initiation inhibitor